MIFAEKIMCFVSRLTMSKSSNKHSGADPIRDFKKFRASTLVPLMEDHLEKAEEEKGRVASVSR